MFSKSKVPRQPLPRSETVPPHVGPGYYYAPEGRGAKKGVIGEMMRKKDKENFSARHSFDISDTMKKEKLHNAKKRAQSAGRKPLADASRSPLRQRALNFRDEAADMMHAVGGSSSSAVGSRSGIRSATKLRSKSGRSKSLRDGSLRGKRDARSKSTKSVRDGSQPGAAARRLSGRRMFSGQNQRIALEQEIEATRGNRELELQQSAKKQKIKEIKMESEICRLRAHIADTTKKMEDCQQETRNATSRLQKAESKLALSEKELDEVAQDRKKIDTQLTMYHSLQAEHRETLRQVDDLKRLNEELATQNASLLDSQDVADLCSNLERGSSSDLADAQSTIKTYELHFF